MGRAKDVWIEAQHHEAAMSSKRSRDGAPVVLIPPVKSWQFLPATSAESGIKSVPLAHKQRPIVLSIQNAFSPFEPSAYVEGATRKTLTLRLNKEWDGAFDCFEACLLYEVAARSQEIFGRSLGEEELAEMYKPLTRKSGEYPRNLRVKLNTTGVYQVRFWASDKTRLDAPATLADTPVNARVALRAVWIGDDAWGIVADCTDVQFVGLSSDECPFE